MRFLLGCMMLSVVLWAGEHPVTFFQESKSNQLLCRQSDFAYRMVSQSNATVVELHGHTFFKLKKENLYLKETGCVPLTGKKEVIIF